MTPEFSARVWAETILFSTKIYYIIYNLLCRSEKFVAICDMCAAEENREKDRIVI